MHDVDSPTATVADSGNHGPNVAHAQYDPDAGERPVPAVLEALGKAADQPVDALDVRLHDAVDPDALDDLFRATRTGRQRDEGRVSFAVGEFSVDIHACGHVMVQRTG